MWIHICKDIKGNKVGFHFIPDYFLLLSIGGKLINLRFVMKECILMYVENVFMRMLLTNGVILRKQ